MLEFFAGPEENYSEGLIADLHRIAELGDQNGMEILLRRADADSVAAGSYLKAGTAATASSMFSIQKNGSQFLTATVAASGTTATFSSSQTDFAAGDVLKIVAPATADATLADIAITLAATLL